MLINGDTSLVRTGHSAKTSPGGRQWSPPRRGMPPEPQRQLEINKPVTGASTGDSIP